MSEEQYRWYTLNVRSGFEKKIKQAILEQSEKKMLLENFKEIFIPVEEVIEIRRGQKVSVEKKVLPGYILIQMIMNDNTWHLVKNIPNVTGFLGKSNKPEPMKDSDVKNILNQIEENTTSNKHVIRFEVGESVKMTGGPFESFNGIVEEIDEEKSRLKISVLIFGRDTLVELEYDKVAKI